MLREDYELRSTNELIESYFRIVYGIKPGQFYDVEQGLLQKDTVYPKVKTMLLDRKVNEAEDLLYEYASPENELILKAGLLFYYHLNELTDDELEKARFSREEIKEGVQEFMRIYGQEGFSSVFQ